MIEQEQNKTTWFNNEELKCLKENRMSRKNQNDKLDGHINYLKICNDIDYLVTDEEQEKIFRSVFTGIIDDIE